MTADVLNYLESVASVQKNRILYDARFFIGDFHEMSAAGLGGKVIASAGTAFKIYLPQIQEVYQKQH